MMANMPTFSATAAKASLSVVFLIYDRFKLLDLTGPLQVFRDANEHIDEGYRTLIVSCAGGPVESDAGVEIQSAPIASAPLDRSTTLIVCGGDGVYAAARDEALVNGLREAAPSCGRVGSTCTGAFLLSAAGLLSGRRAVTHWRRCEALAATTADATIDLDAIFIEDDGVWTSAGVTAGIDLALAMVEADFGRRPALDLARNLLVYVKRPGGQSQFSAALREQTSASTDRFDALHLWIRDNLRSPLTVADLAEFCAMSARSFARRYVAETEVTPAHAVEAIRLEAAMAALETSPAGIKAIARNTGFQSQERMRRAFMRRLGVSPQAYRDRFARTRRPATTKV